MLKFSPVKFFSSNNFVVDHTDENLKLTCVTMADMCKQHTELNVLVCCLSCVRKRTTYDSLEDTDGFHVPQQSYPHFVILALKNFVCLIFVVVGHQ